MTQKIIRIIDVQKNGTVAALEGDLHHTLEWPGPAPKQGDVYSVIMGSSLKIVQQLAEAENENVKLNDAMRWRVPDAQGRTRMQALWQRHLIKREVRNYLHEQGFIEIDMPLLVQGTTPDAQIESFAVEDRYLVTSTEYQIKRMEIGGFDKSYTLTQNFRHGDNKSKRNNPEFTMLEWARVGEPLTAIEKDVEEFTLRAHKALGGKGTLTFDGHVVDLTTPWDRITVRDAIAQATGEAIKDFSAPELLRATQAAKLEIRNEWKQDVVLLYTVLLDHIQKTLGFKKPVFLQEWPSFLTSSTTGQTLQGFTERSELFIAGVEISDGFPTLTDVSKQVSGFERQQDRRRKNDQSVVGLDNKFLEALKEGIPAGAGMALGFDRLVMVLTDRPAIQAVLAFSWDEL